MFRTICVDVKSRMVTVKDVGDRYDHLVTHDHLVTLANIPNFVSDILVTAPKLLGPNLLVPLVTHMHTHEHKA